MQKIDHIVFFYFGDAVQQPYLNAFLEEQNLKYPDACVLEADSTTESAIVQLFIKKIKTDQIKNDVLLALEFTEDSHQINPLILGWIRQLLEIKAQVQVSIQGNPGEYSELLQNFEIR